MSSDPTQTASTSNVPTITHAVTYCPSDPIPRIPHVSILPLPKTLSPHDILIKIHCVALNPVDVQIQNVPLLRYIPGAKGTEFGLGKDFAGEVVAVGGGAGGGDDAEGWKVGDEVMGVVKAVNYLKAPGALSDYLIVDARKGRSCITRKPKELSWEKAAAIPLVTLTALTCLSWLPEAQHKGRREVVVLGASGGVGIAAVQLAKSLYNCRVTAICSASNSEYVTRTLGADEVIDYTAVPVSVGQTLLEILPTESKFYDLVIDCVGGTTHGIFPLMNRLLHPHAAFVSIVGDKSSRLTLGGLPTFLTHPAQLWRLLSGCMWGPKYGCIALDENAEWLKAATEMAAKQELRVEIQEVIQLPAGDGKWEDENRSGMRGFDVLNTARVRGKIVVKLC